MAATGFTPISLYYTTTATTVPVNTNLVNGELAINITDGKLYYKDNAGVVKLLASNSGSAGDVVGPASATDTAVALFDGTTGKLIKNSPVTIGSTGNTVISGTDNTNAMLRITQLGTADALVVEDSANPDSSPFVINSSGYVIAGNTTAFSSGAASALRRFQSLSAGSGEAGFASTEFSNDATTTSLIGMFKSRGTSVGSLTAVQAQDRLGILNWGGADGSNMINAARIEAYVDGTPGTNDMPGRLVFSTTADGAAAPTERMRIDNAGRVNIGGTNGSSYLSLLGTLPVTTVDGIGVNLSYTIPSTSTASGRGFFTQGIATQATAFTLATFRHFEAGTLTIGAGSSVTDQIGFRASSITGATNNYGFQSNLTAATGAWNFYAGGTAANYFAGNVGIGTTTTTSAQLTIAGNSSTSALKLPNIEEVATISATAATGTINYDITTQSVLFYTSNASANWTVNFRGSSGTSLNTLMATGESMSCTFLVTQGATAYYNSVVQVDGTTSGVTTRWQGSAPTSGNASSLDSYTYVIIKTGAATFTVLATQTKFA